jgi:hypothetical protein
MSYKDWYRFSSHFGKLFCMSGVIQVSVLAFVFSLIAAYSFRRRNPWGTFWLYFLIIFFASWAGGIWIKPVGPVLLGVAWIPTLAIAFFMALAIAASAKYAGFNDQVKVQEVRVDLPDEGLKISVLAWLLLISLILTVLAGLL